MRILVISPYYPPLNYARSLQIGKVVKAMNLCQIEPVVITGDFLKLESETVESIKVYRIPHWIRPQKKHIMGRLTSKIMQELYSCNPFSQFVRLAEKKSTELIQNKKIDCIFSSSTPFESHLVGLALSRKSDMPWIASFSDPWPGSINPSPYKEKVPFISAIQEYYLHKVLKRCSAVHLTNKYAIDLIENRTGLPIKDKSFVIPHIGSERDSKKLTDEYQGWLVHTGNLTRHRVSLPLLSAIKKVNTAIPNLFKGLICVGNVCPEFKSLVNKLGLEKCVRMLGHLPQEEAIEIAENAEALLVIEADMKFSPYLPSKFADYIVTGKAVIALTPPVSPIRDYLKKSCRGIAISHDEDLIAAELERFWGSMIRGTACSEKDLLEQSLQNEFQPLSVGNRYKKMLSNILY